MTGADIVFLDFEASSLSKHGYPIEVAWVFASGGEESRLIRPAPGWTDWADDAQAIHGITRDQLSAEGTPHDEVARHMLAALSGHALYATAPSWDGQWLSKLLRGAGLPRHALRLQDTDVAHREAMLDILQAAGVPKDEHDRICKNVLAEIRREDEEQGAPAHRALADAKRELQVWHAVRRRTGQIAAQFGRS